MRSYSDDPRYIEAQAIYAAEDFETEPGELFVRRVKAATRMWVADFNSKSREEMVWLDPRRAHYITKTSPMGYNLAAVSMPMPCSLDFTDMRQHVLAKGK